MSKYRLSLAPAVWVFAFLASEASAAQPSFILFHSLFAPGTNGQTYTRQGWSVAVDGNLVATGAPHEDFGDYYAGVVKIYNAATGAWLHTLTNPTPALLDIYGDVVAVSGTRVVVGAPFDDTGATNAGIAYVYDLAGANPAVPVYTLTNPTPAMDESFGNTLAMSGTRLLVGVANDLVGPPYSGAVYVYDLAGATPTVPFLTLTNPTPANDDSFGYALGLSGTRAVVGAALDSTAALYDGSAYVYDLNGATPAVPILTLTNPTPAEADLYGWAVAISGTRVVVGALLDDDSGLEAGVAYVYDLTSATPGIPFLTLTNPSPAEYDLFGGAVAMSGTRVVVGAGLYEGAVADVGIAYVYDLATPTPGTPSLTLTNPRPASSNSFGQPVAISGNRVVIAAPYDDAVAPGAGQVYVYELAGANPAVPAVTLGKPSPTAKDLFGSFLALSGSLLVAGTPYERSPFDSVGRAYVHDLARPMPTVPAMILTNPAPTASDYFGGPVAVAGSRILVSATGNDTAGTNAGSVYVYNLASSMPAVPEFTLNNPDWRAAITFGAAVAISGARVAVGAPRRGGNPAGDGAAYVYDLAGATPTVPILALTNPTPKMDEGFGAAVALAGNRVAVGVPRDGFGDSYWGSVCIYDLTSAAPARPVLVLTNPSSSFSGGFGLSVSMAENRLVVGAPYGFSTSFTRGRAYVFDLASTNPAASVLTLQRPGPGYDDEFGFSVSISGTRVVAGAYWDNTRAPLGGRVYVFDLASATPAAPVAILDPPRPAASDYFGMKVVADQDTIVVGAPQNDTVGWDRGAAYVFGLRTRLILGSSAPGFITFSWAPTNSLGFVLQYSDSLAPVNWVSAPSGAMNPVTVPATNAARFYRVAQP